MAQATGRLGYDVQKWLMNLTVRHEIFPTIYTNFSESMKSFGTRSSDWRESKVLINLRFCVQSFVLDNRNMTWRDDATRMFCIRLKTTNEQYGITDDKKGFEVL